jgi:hypothetical protein
MGNIRNAIEQKYADVISAIACPMADQALLTGAQDLSRY